MASLESPELARAKAAYLEALALLTLREKTHEQEQDLYEKKISAGRDLLEAKAALEEARIAVGRASQELATLGLSAEGIAKVAGEGDCDSGPSRRETSTLWDGPGDHKKRGRGFVTTERFDRRRTGRRWVWRCETGEAWGLPD